MLPGALVVEDLAVKLAGGVDATVEGQRKCNYALQSRRLTQRCYR